MYVFESLTSLASKSAPESLSAEPSSVPPAYFNSTGMLDTGVPPNAAPLTASPAFTLKPAVPSENSAPIATSSANTELIGVVFVSASADEDEDEVVVVFQIFPSLTAFVSSVSQSVFE